MAAFSALAIGLAAGALGGALLAKRKKKPAQAPAPTGTAVSRDKLAETQVAATKPPDPVATESSNVGQAGIVAARTRRRAAAGNAGRVSSGSSQRSYGGSGAPRSLLGR